MRPGDGGARRRAIRLALCALAFAVGLDLGAAQAAPATSIVVCPTCETRSLAAAIAAATPGSRIEVRGGTYPGGLTIDRPVELVGSGDPVIDGGGNGSLLRIAGARVAISGFVLRGTGDDLDQEDAAIVVDHGQASIVDNQIEDALFGVYLKQSPGSVIRDNVIVSKKLDVARRGDSIKVWYSDDVTIDGNRANDGRDNILWYSNRGVVTNNVFDRGRYGLHLMFSDGARIERNSLQSNSIGLYIMYSRDPLVVGNTLANNHGPSGGGLGLKDVDRATVEGNRFVSNHIAAQIDTSPREPGIENVFRGNVFAFNTIGIGFSPAVRHNTLTANSFIDNNEQVAILGGGELRDITWAVDGRGNYWSDYAGY
ncbi:MAG TPA: nitrous oxide reductase family maturation protein NosD, partial [Thermomicrobiales bacterium]|nr:nitrous oxide reductase family maturation protein NosD [Thermomicrobiales bacterium]